MEILAEGATSPAAALRERWRGASARSVWSYPDDWDHPAVDEVALALAGPAPSAGPQGTASSTGAPLLEACTDLGAARARTGCSIGEAIDDLTCVYAVRGAQPPPDVLRALCSGWADGQLALPLEMLCVDAESGLWTPAYLAVRLRETYGAAAARGVRVQESHALVVVDLELEELPPLQRMARSAAAGRSLTDTFGAGHPVAALGGGQYVVLAETGTDLTGRLAELRVRITRTTTALGVADGTRHPPRIVVEPLPTTAREAAARLAVLGRRPSGPTPDGGHLGPAGR